MIFNQSKNVIRDVNIKVTLIDGDACIGFRKKTIHLEKLRPSQSLPVSISVPEKLSKILDGDGYCVSIEYDHKEVFDREAKHRKALFLYSTELPEKIKLQFDPAYPLLFDMLLVYEQMPDDSEITYE